MKFYVYSYGIKLKRFDDVVKQLQNYTHTGYELVTCKETVSISLLNNHSYVMTSSLYPWSESQIRKYIDFCEKSIAKNNINTNYF